MSVFEKIFLGFYVLFAFAYMARTMGTMEHDSAWARLLMVIFAFVLGPLWFPMVFGNDIYERLNKKEQHGEDMHND